MTENKACIFPPCPKCKEGYMVPFSFKQDVFDKWKCTACSYLMENRNL